MIPLDLLIALVPTFVLFCLWVLGECSRAQAHAVSHYPAHAWGQGWNSVFALATTNSGPDPEFLEEACMARSIIVEAEQKVACPKCNHRFPLSEGISRQAIERQAAELERALAEDQEEARGPGRRRGEGAVRRPAQGAERGAEREGWLARQVPHRGARAAQAAARGRGGEEEPGPRVPAQARRGAQEDRGQGPRRRSAKNSAGARRSGRRRSSRRSARRPTPSASSEQGSQQLQGEALELSLEALLKAAFPLDEILPVPKGVNGADLIQRVRSPSGAVCGTILWEAKQTKAWQPAWLRKLKDEQQEIGAELAVIVTAAMPKDTREPFLRESDVWVARFDAARPLAEALRTSLVELHKQRQANLGRSEKMELLYNYICSPQFAQRLKSVYDGFVAMREELEAEKAAMARMWKKREAQLTRMQDGLLSVVGDLQGIGEDALPALDTIAALPAAEVELVP